MAKMGRPKAENPRSVNLNLRITKEEHVRLQEYAAKHNLTITESVRQGFNKMLDLEEQTQ